MTTQITITNGTEKQITYATEISSRWIASVEAEITEVDRRLEETQSPKLTAYRTALQAGLTQLVTSIGQIPASHIIGLHTTGRDAGQAIIQKCRGGDANYPKNY